MIRTIPEIYRERAVNHLFATKTVENVWPVWQAKIRELLGGAPTADGLLNLGDKLSEIFRTTSESGRSQSAVSAGGNAWESLVCWYLNLCTIGSRVVAFKKMSLVPQPIRDAITVKYGNFECNTESDITVVVFPNLEPYLVAGIEVEVVTSSDSIKVCEGGNVNTNIVDQMLSKDFRNLEIGIVQCKTNWNDNAQIPMLWDLIYSSNGFREKNITIGINNFNIQNSKGFTYSFVTVPTTTGKLKSTSVAVRRVAGLSGGNYWGNKSHSGIASSLKDIFTNNFGNGWRKSLREDIDDSVDELDEDGALAYFRL